MVTVRNFPHVATMCALIAIASLFALLVAPPPKAQAVASPSQEQLNHANQIAAIFDEHNQHRRAHGLRPLVFSPAISLRVSQPFSNQMATANNGTIWHNSHANIGRGGGNWGENVAGGPQSEDAAALVQRWMDSPGHRKNILNPSYTTIAIGVAHPDRGSWAFSTVNMYGSPSSPGTTYATGAAWLATLRAESSVNVYLTPGTHRVGGRDWRTVCEPYSRTQRCTTEIWATQTVASGGSYREVTGWVFNNLTYAPSQRSLWVGNPLGGNGVVAGKVSWTSGGRQWRTECDTATTGRNGCRSYTTATVVVPSGNSYRTVEREIFNNIVLFNG